MYQIKNKIYSDAGYILQYKNMIAYAFSNVDINDVTEIKIELDDMVIKGNRVQYLNGLLIDTVLSDYGELKKNFIKKQFSNDDQIAIMLNKDDSDDDLMLFNKMQEWRAWSSTVAKKIVSML